MQEDSILVPKIEVDNTAPSSASRMQPLFPQPSNSQPPQKPAVDDPPKLKGFPWGKIVFAIGVILLALLLYVGVVAFLLYTDGMKLKSSVTTLSQTVKSKDLGKIKIGIEETKKELNSFDSVYKLIAWVRVVPWVGGYVSDLGHVVKAGQAGLDASDIVLTVAEPYSDLLGLGGATMATQSGLTGGAQTTQERIDFIVQTVPQLLPKMDSISADMKVVQDEISQIDANRYPESFRGLQLRRQIENGQNLVDQVATLLISGKPILQNLPYFLGMDSPRTYFVLFQNDKELRPTGGFMTAYAIMKVDKAKAEPVLSDDIYNLDAKYKPTIPAPGPIVKYIKGPYIISQNLRLRDMNWSPDFEVSMDQVDKALSTLGINNIDGIIAVDTQALVNLLDVTGPIGVPGFGTFSTQIDPQCNCAQVIHALEAYADIEGPIIWDPVTGKIIYEPKNAANRKKIIGPLMNSILANAMGQPKDKLASLFSAVFNSITEKHVLFYMTDNKMEKEIADFGIGGTVNQDYGGDYLYINDANLGGRKSNLYVTEDVEQDIKVASDGTVTKTLTITYKNPQSQDGWLNSVLPDWVRVYVPKGSQLISSDGLEASQTSYEDLGRTVFAGYFQLRPEGVSKVTFEYKLPFKVKGQYYLLIQKQPGTDGYLYTINLGKYTEEFYLKRDREIKIGL